MRVGAIVDEAGLCRGEYRGEDTFGGRLGMARFGATGWCHRVRCSIRAGTAYPRAESQRLAKLEYLS